MAAPTREEFDTLLKKVQEQDVYLQHIHVAQKAAKKELDSFLYNLQEQGKQARGTRGMDFQLYQQFMTAQIAHIMESFQEIMRETLQNSLQLERIDILVKKTDESFTKIQSMFPLFLKYVALMEHSKTLLEQLVETKPQRHEVPNELYSLLEQNKDAEQQLLILQKSLKGKDQERDDAERRAREAEEKLTELIEASDGLLGIRQTHTHEARLAALQQYKLEKRTHTAKAPHECIAFPPTIKKCFYTASFGNPGQTTDKIQPFQTVPGWDYILFTNLPIQSPSWQIRTVQRTHGDPAIEAKTYKWQSHLFLPDYDVVVWIDSYMSPIPKLVSALEDTLYTCFFEEKTLIVHRPHAERSCIWEECDAVVKARRATPQAVERNRVLLQAVSMPRHYGLFDTNIVAKLHLDPAVQQVGNQIVETLRRASNRDQLAVTYVYYKEGFKLYSVRELQNYTIKTGTHVRIPAYL